MKLHNYIADSLRQYRRSHVPVMLGVAVATAVLTGALLVGDSVRGSLRDLTLQRLGAIDHALVTRQPFRVELARELASQPEFNKAFAAADVAFLLRGSISSTASGDKKRFAGGVSVVGVTENFAQHGDAPWARSLSGDQAAITRALADDLGVATGDELLLRLPTLSAMPADSPLGEKTETTIGKRLIITRILPAEGIARFALFPTQTEPRNLFLSINTVQRLLEQPGKANALLVDGVKPDQPTPQAGDDALQDLLRPTLADYGLSVDELPDGVVQIESSQLVLPDNVVKAIAAIDAETPRVSVATYLANTISAGEQSISYSTVSGIDSVGGGGPLVDAQGAPIQLANDEVALNDWAAKRLDAQVGDQITITYYEPESTHGELVEAAPLQLRLKAILPLASDSGEPTTAADPRLTPTLEGVTDADTIDDWDLPFELTEPITGDDDRYWEDHATTPKAFVSFALAKRLWATRWGSVSLVRVQGSPEQVAKQLTTQLHPADMGLALQPVKRLGLAASSGTTPFDGLFFGFSLFLIASAVMLIALLFGLGVEQRAKELGLLSAVGWPQTRIRSALAREGMWVALAGMAIGVPLGVAYAWLMILGLTTLWVEAIVTPFLTLHITPRSLAIGAAIGLLVAWLTIRWVTGRLLNRPARELLGGQVANPLADNSSGNKWKRWMAAKPRAALVLLAAACGLAAAATRLRGDAQAGAFFGSGAALLISLLLLLSGWLRRGIIRQAAPRHFRLWSLALRNVGRNASRSVLTIALVAAASFLILAISAFRLAPSDEGTGGFDLVGHSDQPIHFDLNQPDGRLELGLSQGDESLLELFQVHALRLHDGEDASCLNLYQTRQPRVLGLPDSFIERGRFAFADSIVNQRRKGFTTAAWKALAGGDAAADSPTGNQQSAIPVILDFNTAMYSLKLYGGVGSQFEIRDQADRPVTLKVVGLLKNSLLQGDLLMSEANFLKLFPSDSGSRFFLIAPRSDALPRGGGPPVDQLAAMLEDRLSDYGMDIERADRRLAGFLAVQNTYLSTFQTLGALGLLLGVVGVAVVQLRSIAERRGELALLRASGFSPIRLHALVLRENLLLLGGGLLIGALAAALALAPQTTSALSATDANVPWSTSGLLVGVILAIGLAVGGLATHTAARAEIVPALRGD